MRAWGKPDPNVQREGPPNPAFVPSPERAFVPRHAQERTFVQRGGRNHPPLNHEGLPARPPPPSDFSSMPSAGGVRRPPPSGSRQLLPPGARQVLPASDERTRSPPRDRGPGNDADILNHNADVRVCGFGLQ
jgi:hypothetical protein